MNQRLRSINLWKALIRRQMCVNGARIAAAPVLTVVLMSIHSGCGSGDKGAIQQDVSGKPGELVPVGEAIGYVNNNIRKIPGTLRAIGDVDGAFRDAKGKRRSYNVDGTLFYLHPSHFRFDLKKLGDHQFTFGSNRTWFWFINETDDDYYCGRHGVPGDIPDEIPARPDQMIDALGLTPLTVPAGAAAKEGRKVSDEFQQVLFKASSSGGGSSHVEREYWLDMRGARLVRRVLFRDEAGRVEMDAKLDGYKPLTPGGPFLPTSVTVVWPKSQGRLRFNVQRWNAVGEVGPSSNQFSTPPACGAP